MIPRLLPTKGNTSYSSKIGDASRYQIIIVCLYNNLANTNILYTK